MIINIDKCVKAMSDHWVKTLGNEISYPLTKSWEQNFITFNNQIEGTNKEIWQILQPPTGSGKTQSLIVYCSLLSKLRSGPDGNYILEKARNPTTSRVEEKSHPGVLIVTRLTKEADDLADDINELSKCKTARVHHSKSPLSEKELISTPVLIVTHSAFKGALRVKCDDSAYDRNFQLFHNCQTTDRRLVIIDEALDMIDHAKVDIEHLKQTLSLFTDHFRARFPEEIEYLRNVRDWMRKVSSDSGHEHLVTDKNILSKQPDFSNLRLAIRGLRHDNNIVALNDPRINRRLQRKISETLDAVESMANHWSWFAMSGERATLNTARFIVPEGYRGAVIMDATASTSLIYRLFKDKASVIKAPAGVRQYDNVTIHVSLGHNVGKGSLQKNASTECTQLIRELNSKIPHEKKVFVCCHKAVEPILTDQDDLSEEYDVAHWGEIDGRNTWQHFDTVVIFGLPYRGSVWSANTFMAMQGPQGDEWLNTKENRSFEDILDIRDELDIGAISTNVIQAINRVHCRRVIDSQGNCPQTDIYILLPNGKTGTRVLDNIEKAMPGIKSVYWQYSGTTRKVRKSKYENSIVKFLKNVQPGETAAREVERFLEIPRRSFEVIKKNLKDPTHQISKLLKDIGITFHVTGAGRGSKSYFLKAYE